MVKLGPKLPPPTRRELARIDKELRRAAQQANPIQFGEPREHLAFLLSKSKRARYKHPEIPAFEQSRRKWEKNQMRAQARRLARDLERNPITDRRVDCPNDDLPAIDDGQDNVGSMSPTTQAAFSEVAIAYPNASSESHGIFVSSPQYCAVLDSSSKWLLRDEEALSPPEALEPAFQRKEDLVLIPLTPSPSTPCLDNGVISTDAFCNDKKLLSPSYLSGTEVEYEYDAAPMTPKTSAVIKPIRESLDPLPSEAPTAVPIGDFSVPKSPVFANSVLAPSQVPPGVSACDSSVRRSLVLVHSVAASSRLSFRQENRMSKSFIFSGPLDFTKYSNNSRSNRSSQSGLSSRAYRYSARQPDFNESGININGPPNFLGSSLSSGSKLVTASSTDLLPGLPVLPRTLRSEISDSHRDLGRISGFPESISFLTSRNPRMTDISGWSSNSGACSIELGKETGSELDKGRLVLWRNENGIDVDFDHMDVDDLFYNFTRPQRVIYPPSPAENPLPQNQEKSSMFYASQHHRPFKLNLSEAADCHNLSSNNAVSRANGHTPGTNHSLNVEVISKAEIPPSIFPSFSKDHVMAPVTALAPAAQITQEQKFIRIGERCSQNVQVHEAESEAEQRTAKRFLKIRSSDSFSHASAIKSLPLAHLVDGPGQQSVNVASPPYPDTHLASERGYVPPVSTPTSKPPPVFAMALPSPPWSPRTKTILPTHVAGAAKANAGRSSGFMLALKRVFKKTVGYFWQRR